MVARKKVAAKDKTNGDDQRVIQIPKLEQKAIILRLIGDAPLLVNNKLSVAYDIAKKYSGSGKTKKPNLPPRTEDQEYVGSFYVLPVSPHSAPHKKGLYGVPASGFKKCLQKGIRPAGFTDNTTIGEIDKGFRVCADNGGLCLLRHNGFEKDTRPVNIGSGQKTVPQLRHRAIFAEWEIHLRFIFNVNKLSEEQLANLAMYAGAYIGMCEMRAEKRQGECGGFVVGGWEDVPTWAQDKRWGVSIDATSGFRVLKGKVAQ